MGEYGILDKKLALLSESLKKTGLGPTIGYQDNVYSHFHLNCTSHTSHIINLMKAFTEQ